MCGALKILKSSLNIFSPFSEIILAFESKVNDRIQILAFKDEEFVGEGFVPIIDLAIHEVIDDQFYTLKIKTPCKKYTFGEFPVKIEFVNEDQPFFRDIIHQKIKNYLKKLVDQIFEIQDPKLCDDFRTEFQYGVMITEKKIDGGR